MRFVLIVLLIAIIGGAGALATWKMPAPTATVEKEIPNSRFANE